MTESKINRAGASSDALLDRTIAHLRKVLYLPDDAKELIAEYDRLRAQSSAVESDGDQRWSIRGTPLPKSASPEIAAAPVACGDVCGLAKSTGIICAEGECDIAAKHPRAQPQASVADWECPNCQVDNPSKFDECGNCGVRLTETKAIELLKAWEKENELYGFTVSDLKKLVDTCPVVTDAIRARDKLCGVRENTFNHEARRQRAIADGEPFDTVPPPPPRE